MYTLFIIINNTIPGDLKTMTNRYRGSRQTPDPKPVLTSAGASSPTLGQH